MCFKGKERGNEKELQILSHRSRRSRAGRHRRCDAAPAKRHDLGPHDDQMDTGNRRNSGPERPRSRRHDEHLRGVHGPHLRRGPDPPERQLLLRHRQGSPRFERVHRPARHFSLQRSHPVARSGEALADCIRQRRPEVASVRSLTVSQHGTTLGPS